MMTISFYRDEFDMALLSQHSLGRPDIEFRRAKIIIESTIAADRNL